LATLTLAPCSEYTNDSAGSCTDGGPGNKGQVGCARGPRARDFPLRHLKTVNGPSVTAQRRYSRSHRRCKSRTATQRGPKQRHAPPKAGGRELPSAGHIRPLSQRERPWETPAVDCGAIEACNGSRSRVWQQSGVGEVERFDYKHGAACMPSRVAESRQRARIARSTRTLVVLRPSLYRAVSHQHGCLTSQMPCLWRRQSSPPSFRDTAWRAC